MVLKCLGSGSSGNCYILENESEALILEAGISFKEVKCFLDFQTAKIKGVLSSHGHNDHRKYLHEYEKAGIYCLYGDDLFGIGFRKSYDLGTAHSLGGFLVYPFPVEHDVKCFGYLIGHEEIGQLLFVTDTEYIKYKFHGLNHIMVEANYSQEIIDENMNNGRIVKSLRDRIMKSHMSIDTAIGIVEANKNPGLRNVILLHLSGHNSDRKAFKERMQEAAGNYVNVEVAHKGMEIDINRFPF